MGEGISKDLSALGGDGGVTVLHGPFVGIYGQSEPCREGDIGLIENFPEHGETVGDRGPADAKGGHDAGGKDGGASCVTEAQNSLDRGEQLEAEGAGVLFVEDVGYGFLVNGLHEAGHRIRDPLVQGGKDLGEEGYEIGGGKGWDGQETYSRFKNHEEVGHKRSDGGICPGAGEGDDDIIEYFPVGRGKER